MIIITWLVYAESIILTIFVHFYIDITYHVLLLCCKALFESRLNFIFSYDGSIMMPISIKLQSIFSFTKKHDSDVFSIAI